MNVSNLTKELLTNDIIDKLLFSDLEYNNSVADCILVLGSRSALKYRVPKAIELFNNHKGKMILFSGGRKLEIEGHYITEASLMKSGAIDMGINEVSILIDELSLNTKENMICSQIELERAFKLTEINKVILVTTTYHMRRSMMMARMFLPNWIDIIPCPADDNNTKRSNFKCKNHWFIQKFRF